MFFHATTAITDTGEALVLADPLSHPDSGAAFMYFMLDRKAFRLLFTPFHATKGMRGKEMGSDDRHHHMTATSGRVNAKLNSTQMG